MRILLLAILLSATPLAAQDDTPEGVVRDYVGLYTARTVTQWKNLFHPQLTVASSAEDGSIRIRNLEQFYGAQERGFKEDPGMKEVLENVRIAKGRRIARVTADYIFTSEGKPARGKLGLHLVRGNDGWKIVAIIFSYDDEKDCGASCAGAKKR